MIWKSIMAAVAGLVLATGCADSINAADMSAGSRKSVIALGITASPITPEQAKAIAEKETGGTAIEVEAETEDGVAVYEVEVRVGTVVKEVVIRASDGAVLLVEMEDDDEGDDEDDDGTAPEKDDDRS